MLDIFSQVRENKTRYTQKLRGRKSFKMDSRNQKKKYNSDPPLRWDKIIAMVTVIVVIVFAFMLMNGI